MGVGPDGAPLPKSALTPFRFAACGTKAGKGQPLDAVVYTPSGPRRMGDLRVGDTVLTPTGQTTVEEIYPLGVRELFRVIFHDGTEVMTTDDHLWEVHSYRGTTTDRNLPWPRLLTTTRLAQYQTELRRLWVPPVLEVEYQARPVPIDPYVVGVLIGDGGMSQQEGSIRLSTIEPEILESVRAAIPKGYQIRQLGRCDYAISMLTGYRQRAQVRLIPSLKELDLWGKYSYEKRIPEVYRYNSQHVRLQILRGILDTDGSVDKHGQPVLEQTSKELAEDVSELVASLGGYCKTTVKQGSYCLNGERKITRLVYRTRIRYADAPELFQLSRKRDACRHKKRGLPRKFQSIERCAIQAEAQCIRLADPRGLYLTNGMIPTHNTFGCALGLLLRFLNEEVPCCWTAPVNRQLEDAWRRYFRPILMSLPKNMVRISDSWGMWSVELRGTSAAMRLRSGEDAGSLRGSSYDYVVCDEASQYPQDSYESLLTNLSDTNGVLWAISTPPRHKRGAPSIWFQQGWLLGEQQAALGLTGEERTHQSWRVPSASNPAPTVQTWVKRMRQVLGEDSETFRREYLAEFISDDGTVFRRIIKLHRSEPTPYQEGHTYCYGWDPALTADASVVSIWDVGERREVHLERLPANDWRAQLARLQFLLSSYHCSRGRFDATSLGGQVTFDQLGSMGIPGEPYSFNQHTKADAVQALALAMEAEEPRFLNDDVARREMEAYAYTVLPSGVVRYQAADGQHDDHVAARILAWVALTRGRLQVFFDKDSGADQATPQTAAASQGWTPVEDDMEALFKRSGSWAGVLSH